MQREIVDVEADISAAYDCWRVWRRPNNWYLCDAKNLNVCSFRTKVILLKEARPGRKTKKWVRKCLCLCLQTNVSQYQGCSCTFALLQMLTLFLTAVVEGAGRPVWDGPLCHRYPKNSSSVSHQAPGPVWRSESNCFWSIPRETQEPYCSPSCAHTQPSTHMETLFTLPEWPGIFTWSQPEPVILIRADCDAVREGVGFRCFLRLTLLMCSNQLKWNFLPGTLLSWAPGMMSDFPKAQMWEERCSVEGSGWRQRRSSERRL